MAVKNDDLVGMVSAKEVAQLLSCSVRKVRTLRSYGHMPQPAKLGHRTVRWYLPEIREWMASGCPNRDKWEAMKGVMN